MIEDHPVYKAIMPHDGLDELERAWGALMASLLAVEPPLTPEQVAWREELRQQQEDEDRALAEPRKKHDRLRTLALAAAREAIFQEHTLVWQPKKDEVDARRPSLLPGNPIYMKWAHEQQSVYDAANLALDNMLYGSVVEDVVEDVVE